jgi:hypothetical protein
MGSKDFINLARNKETLAGITIALKAYILLFHDSY